MKDPKSRGKIKGRSKGKGKGSRTRRNNRNKSQITAKKVTEGNTATTKEPEDFVEVRKNIATLVRMSAKEIANAFIEMAKAGQLAPAKYLFEAVGLYPPTAETLSKPENSLAYTLLKRMGLPTDPVIGEEDPPLVLTSVGKPAARGACVVAENSESEGQRDQKPDAEIAGRQDVQFGSRSTC